MMTGTPRTDRYALSFTSGTLLAGEAAVVAPIYLHERDWKATRALAQAENLLGTRVARSNTRTLGALLPRLQLLTDNELQIVADGTSTERGHLMWTAACRQYDLIGEFAEEVLRERFLTLAGTVSYEDYDSFYRAKAMWHDELDDVTDLLVQEAPAGAVQDDGRGGSADQAGPHRACASLCPRRRVPGSAHAERHPLLPDEGGVRAVQPRTTLTQQEEHLFKVLSSERFLKMEGLGNEVAHFIYDYDPTWALDVAQAKKRIKTKLDTDLGIKVFEINLYDLCVELLKERNVWDRVLAAEPTMDKPDFLKMLQNMLDPQMHLAPAIKSRIEAESFQILFLTGIGEVFPFVRSHTVLNNLQTVVSDKPMLMFFPGRYEVSATQGSSLVLFGQLKDDSFYRAKRILDQEA